MTALKKPTVLLIRHGATDYNSETKGERLRGWLNVPLNEKGQEEAEHAGALLAKDGVPISRIVASDLSRTRETAERVAKHTGDPVVTLTRGLRPWNLGEMSGQPLKKILPEMQYFLDHEQEAPPQGEPFVAFQGRALETIIPLTVEAIAHPERGAIVIVSHSRVARLLRGWFLGGCRADGTIDMQPLLDKEEAAMTGHVMVLQYNEGSKKWELSDESALDPDEDDDKKKSKKENPMSRDPIDILGEQVAQDLGFDWGSLATGVVNTAGGAMKSAQEDKDKNKAASDQTSALQKSLAADSAWAQAEAALELTPSNSSAKVVRDSAKADATRAGGVLNSENSTKRCSTARDNLKDAASASAKSPKDNGLLAKMHAWQKISDACNGSGSSSDDDEDGDKKGKGKGKGKEGGGSFLTAYHGPLPTWGWGLVAIGGLGALILIVRAMRHRKK